MRLYDRLFTDEDPSEIKDKELSELLNPESLEVVKGCRIEPFLAGHSSGSTTSSSVSGYFCLDPDSRPDHLVFNRTVSLKDTWKKVNK